VRQRAVSCRVGVPGPVQGPPLAAPGAPMGGWEVQGQGPHTPVLLTAAPTHLLRMAAAAARTGRPLWDEEVVCLSSRAPVGWRLMEL